VRQTWFAQPRWVEGSGPVGRAKLESHAAAPGAQPCTTFLVALQGVAVWMVLVKAGDGLLEGGDAVDQLGEAVPAQAAALEASVAVGAAASVLVSAYALDVADAREVAHGVVGAGLERIGRAGRAVAMSVFAEDGRVAYRRSKSS
jgi:hypothetical protein